MKEILFFDTETTGLPDWKQPSEDECQPHMVQLAAIKVDSETHEIKQSLDIIIKPNGWVIPDETIEVHGITNEYANDVGIPEKMALEIFLAMHSSCKNRIAYNTTFDNRIVRIATKRYSDEIVIDNWKSGPYECAMILSQKVIGGKRIKLIDAFKHFTGHKLTDAHNAMADTKACADVYFAAKSALAAKEVA